MAESFLHDYLTPLSNTGWGIETVKPGPDAADGVLLSAGGSSSPPGTATYGWFLVITPSPELAELARLHVVSLPHKLSFRLRRCAQSVTLLDPGLLTTSIQILAA